LPFDRLRVAFDKLRLKIPLTTKDTKGRNTKDTKVILCVLSRLSFRGLGG
jgi:hypothetical protein